MTRLAQQLLVSEVSRKALQLLSQPPNILHRGTPYEGPETPYLQDASDPAPDAVTVFISMDRRYGSAYGDADHWERSEACAIPSVSFYSMLAGLKAGKTAITEVPATITETDLAWGVDCENPHETVTREEEPILLHIEISTDEKAVTLKLLRQIAHRYVHYASLQREGSAQRLESVRVKEPFEINLRKHERKRNKTRKSAIDFIQKCTSDFKFDPGRTTITTDPQCTLTSSGFGWDEGYDSYCVFNAVALLAAVESHLAGGNAPGRVLLEGVEYYHNIELRGFGDNTRRGIWEDPNTRAARAEVLIDFAKKKFLLHRLDAKAQE